MNRQPLALEVTPATYDEIAGLLQVAPGHRVDLGGIELRRGPIPPLMLTKAEIDECLQRSRGEPEGLCRLIEFAVFRRFAQRRR